MGANGDGGEIDRLAEIAAETNLATGVAELQGELVRFINRETAAYMAQAGDAWTDDGLAAWIKKREAEMNQAWRADLATLVGDALPPPAEIKAPSASEILEAGEAWRRGEANDEHTRVLFDAVTQMHGQFMQRIEREMVGLRPGEDPNERLAPYRDEMRRLFRRDVEALVRHARGGPA